MFQLKKLIEIMRKNNATSSIIFLLFICIIAFPVWHGLIIHPRSVAALIEIAENDAARLTNRLVAPLHAQSILRPGATPSSDVMAEILSAMAVLDVVQVRLYDADGAQLWRSGGDVNLDVDAILLDRVASGHAYSRLSRRLANNGAARDVVESYAPIMTDGRFLGAVKVDLDVTARMSTLAQTHRTALLGAFGVATALLVVAALTARSVVVAQRVRDQEMSQLKDCEERFRDMVRSAQDGVIEMDARGRIAYWNPAAERIFGLSADCALDRNLHEVLAPERFRSAFRAAYPHFLQTGEGDFIGRHVELIALRADGVEFPVEVSLSPLTGRRRGHALGVVRDVSARKESEQNVKLGARVMDYAMNGIIVTDADARIQLVNPAFTRLTGYSLRDVVGKTPHVLRSGRHDADFYAAMWSDLKTKGEWQGEIWNRRKTGEIYPEWLCLTAINDNQGCTTHYIAIFSDITKRKEEERDLERLAFYDPLTGVANRLLFRERLSLALREIKRYGGSQLVVFYIDLDWFKQVNDNWGHDAGDLLLQKVAQRLERLMRSVDTVARLGGDEFAILAKTIPDVDTALAIGDKIVATLTESFDLDGPRCVIGASVGIALYPDHGDDVDELIRCADTAMYCAKHQGRNRRHLYQPGIDARDDSGAM